MVKGMDKVPYPEKVIEKLHEIALKPALLVKVKSILGNGNGFGLREPGDEKITMFRSQSEAHKHWKKEWLVAGVNISQEIESIHLAQVSEALEVISGHLQVESLATKAEMN